MHARKHQQSTSVPRAAVAVLLCLLAALASCTNPVGLASSTLVPEQPVLVYYEWLKSASPSAVELELRSIGSGTRAGGQQDVKRALLLSVPPTATEADEAEAIRLLTAVAAQPASINVAEDYRLFASHWLDMLQLRQQLREFGSEQDRSNATLDSLRQTYDELERRYEVLTSVMDSLEKQNALLAEQNKLMQQQIEALTAIEQQLVGQDFGGATGTP